MFFHGSNQNVAQIARLKGVQYIIRICKKFVIMIPGCRLHQEFAQKAAALKLSAAILDPYFVL
jgi:hypothetical protein